MRETLPKSYVRKLMRAIIEFELIEPNDRILIGLSGGKDSAFLVYALGVLRRHFPFKFDIGAITIDLGFTDKFDRQPLEDFCRRLDVPFFFEKTQIAEIAFSPSQPNPCAACAFFRKGIISACARAEGFNKVAFAHHLDDAVETFLMSQLFSGQIRTFLPKTQWDRSGLALIKPLVYLREKEIKGALRFIGFEPIPGGCPRDKKTKRETTKQLIKSLVKEHPQVFENLTAAMRRQNIADLWPPEPTKKEIWQKSQKFWQQKKANR
ncbi:PP-loop domain-containing protein [Thermincola ferriacetica]|uniref:PP-loop domain-containing protein n=1 Tax=Thermincola ferriacetica TaxID=281456 RepID=A0A0L6VY08_9FIRM|nr:tRNA 2-thiocytidine biosynthesis TtcA family protein [Thermincola ferriacetica]KNZ68217.1 PP-loop domain-containing protein [Thermincola ferriacetica]